MSPVAKHRWKIILAVILGLVLVTDVLLVRQVLKPKPRPAQDIGRGSAANSSDTLDTTPAPTPPRPVRPLFRMIPALSFDDKNGARANFDHLAYWDRRTWIRYNAVDFGDGASSVVAELLCEAKHAGNTLFLHIDAQDGPVIAELTVPGTQGFEAITAPVHGAMGVHDVFLTCSEGGFNLRSIKFIRSQSATNLIPAVTYSAHKGIKEPRPGVVGNTDGGDWIKYDQIDFGSGVASVAVDLAIGEREATLGFRLDAPDGPVIATLIPKSTGDWSTFQIQEAPAQSTSGIHDLYITFAGARGLPDLRSIQFKAR
jgi:hypothetical protein